MRSSTDAREEEYRRKLASERDDSSLASSPRYEDKPTIGVYKGLFSYTMRTKRGASSPSQRNALSFSYEDETGLFRLPGLSYEDETGAFRLPSSASRLYQSLYPKEIRAEILRPPEVLNLAKPKSASRPRVKPEGKA